MTEDQLRKTHDSRDLWLALGLSLFAAIAFYFSTKATLHDLDYTSQIASALLHGHLGLQEKPPDWLNEMIPWEGKYYSAFPLGAVLSMLPVALLRETGLIQSFPGRALAALIAGLSVYFFFQLAKAFEVGDSDLFARSPIRRFAVSPNFVGPLPDFRNLDVVQSRIRWRMANRSRPGFAGTSRSALLELGPAGPFSCRSLFRPGFWESDRAAHHAASLPLFSLAPAR